MKKFFLYFISLFIFFFLNNKHLYAGYRIIPDITLVIKFGQYPKVFQEFKPSQIYLCKRYDGKFYKGLQNWDTIINLKGFLDSIPIKSKLFYRLIFANNSGKTDSIWQCDMKFRIIYKAYNLGNDLLTIVEYDTLKRVTDKWIFNYGQKIKDFLTRAHNETLTLEKLVRKYDIYVYSDRNNYSVPSVWVVSIGIDDYGTTRYKNCKSDAQSYVTFFRKQFNNLLQLEISDLLFHEYLLLDSFATRKSILDALKDISIKAIPNDYFIFNFTGQSNLFTTDSINYKTYFFPYNVKGDIVSPTNRNISDKSEVKNNLISLNTLQEYIQLIPATNQLFISEAGPSKKFKTEFIKSLMQNSPEVAKILNKNRIIIVPNEYGYDNCNCFDRLIEKGPINYYLTSLDSAFNIFYIFNENKSGQITFKLKEVEYKCHASNNNYFDVFFERQFLNQYKDIFGDGENQTRGTTFKNNKLKEAANFTGKKYALIVGTDGYQSDDWPKLSNPIYDAKEVADELTNSYNYNVQLLNNPTMNAIYTALQFYYDSLRPEDQLILYFAGHGDFDDKFLDDGFIVCSDSKSIANDPVRNSYIQFAKLRKMINKLPAKQILLILDICHAGVFDDEVLGSTMRENAGNTIKNRNVLQFLKDNSVYKTRYMLSSVGKESAFDGKAGRHSPFANLLLQVLRAKGAGSEGIVTLSSICAVLQLASLNETETLKITPHKAPFGNTDPMGEFILIPEAPKKLGIN